MAGGIYQTISGQMQEARGIASANIEKTRYAAEMPVQKKFLNNRIFNNAGVGKFGAIPMIRYSRNPACVTCFGP